MIVNGNHIRVTAERDPENLKWDEVGAEYVVESTGLFLAYDKAEIKAQADAAKAAAKAGGVTPKKPAAPEWRKESVEERLKYALRKKNLYQMAVVCL